MSDNWVVQNLQNALETWNEKLAEIWQLITTTPQNFKGGGIWAVIVNINGAVQAIGLALLVLFFVVGMVKTCGSFAEVKKPEHAVKLFIRFALAKAGITYGMELMLALFNIVQGTIGTIMTAAGFTSAQQTTLPQEMIDTIESCGFFESIPLWAVTLIGGLFITVMSFLLIMTVYGRFFKLYMYTALAPIPLSTFAGEPSQNVGKSFIKSYCAVCLEGAVIVLACIIATVVAAITILILIVYRRQVKMTCRQLAFLKEHQTNLRLTSDLPLKELNELVDGINDILDLSREIRKSAQQSEDSLKETITNLSHDIRTPLTSMDGYFQLLVQSDSEEERQHYIAVIQNRITSLKDMLEELFTYTKLQNESYELAVESLDFGKCVFDTVFSFYDEFQKKDIEPKIDFCEGHLFIAGNHEAIRRALQNIIKNALEHGQKKIVFELQQNNDQVIFRCLNDVENPDEIDMAQVFSRFYKADSARSNTSTGLGLSIAKGLIEKMGGTIQADLNANIFAIEIGFLIQD